MKGTKITKKNSIITYTVTKTTLTHLLFNRFLLYLYYTPVFNIHFHFNVRNYLGVA